MLWHRLKVLRPVSQVGPLRFDPELTRRLSTAAESRFRIYQVCPGRDGDNRPSVNLQYRK